MTSTLALLAAVDQLYGQVVTDPGSWRPEDLAAWADDVGSDGLTREQARLLRRCVRVAEKLQRHWADPPSAVTAGDWRSRVDMAVGVPAWRPTLELAESGMETEPSEALFDEMAARFRLVHSAPFMDGVDYDTWASRTGTRM